MIFGKRSVRLDCSRTCRRAEALGSLLNALDALGSRHDDLHGRGPLYTVIGRTRTRHADTSKRQSEACVASARTIPKDVALSCSVVAGIYSSVASISNTRETTSRLKIMPYHLINQSTPPPTPHHPMTSPHQPFMRVSAV